jgi:hypothetical protein
MVETKPGANPLSIPGMGERKPHVPNMPQLDLFVN